MQFDIPHLAAEFRHAIPLLIPGALHVLEALVILAIGIWIAGKSDRITNRMLEKAGHFDEMLRGFFGNIVRYFILTITGLTVLGQFGVQTASLVTVIGAASLAIGLALQGTLSNLAAGVMLLIFRPFRLGHNVTVGGNTGTVHTLTLFWTEIVTDTNAQILVPNSSVWGQALRNTSIYPQSAKRISVRFPLPGNTDLATTRTRALGVISGLERVSPEPPPEIMFDRSTTDYTLLLYVKFTPKGDDDEASSAVIEAVETELRPVPVID